MSNESIKGPESIESAIGAAVRELGLLNINANFENTEEIPALITLDGAIDPSVPGNATDNDIEYVVNKMKRDYKGFDFTYNRQGIIAVMPIVN